MAKGTFPDSHIIASEADREPSFVEFETANDLKTAVDKLDNREFKGSTVRCVADVSIVFLC